MSGLQAFNDMLQVFMDELVEVFPENKDIAMFASGLSDVIAVNAKMPMKMFMDAIGPHAKQVAARDEHLFDTMDFPGIDFKALWASDISPATKDAIWQYISTLLLLGTTVSSVPEDVLASIEQMAAECAQKIQDGDLSMEDMMAEVMGKMQGMDLSSLENLDLGALTSGLGIDAGMLGGMNPEMLGAMASMMGGGGEQDALALLEAAKPPEKPKKKRKSHKKK
jgi:hypothetical protein